MKIKEIGQRRSARVPSAPLNPAMISIITVFCTEKERYTSYLIIIYCAGTLIITRTGST